MRKTVLSILLLAAAILPAAPQAQRAHLLLRLEGGRTDCYAVADAYARMDGDRLLDWRLQVTYYPAGRLQAGGVVDRHYGAFIAQSAGPDNIDLQFQGSSLRFKLPTPGGDHGIPVQASLGIGGHWVCSGHASFDDGKRVQRWTVSSVQRIQAAGVDLRD